MKIICLIFKHSRVKILLASLDKILKLLACPCQYTSNHR